MLIFLDKDGTLVEPASGSQFIKNPTDQKLLPSVAGRIAELKAMGATLVIASNQGGVAAGHKSLEAAISEMQFCLKLLPDVEYAFFCPDFEGTQCFYVHQSNVDASPKLVGWEAHKAVASMDLIGTFRKPQPGMLQAAQRLYPMLAAEAMIGDSADDRNAAAAADIAFIDAEAWRSGKVTILPKAFIA